MTGVDSSSNKENRLSEEEPHARHVPLGAGAKAEVPTGQPQCLYREGDSAQCLYHEDDSAQCLYHEDDSAQCLYLEGDSAQCLYHEDDSAQCLYREGDSAQCLYYEDDSALLKTVVEKIFSIRKKTRVRRKIIN